MRVLQNMSLRRKQMLVMMLTSSVALLLACATFVVFDVLKFRKELVESVSSLAEVVGNNTTAALDFNDPATATQTLSALRGEPDIVLAHIHTPDGQTFATYVREGAHTPSEIPLSVVARHEFTPKHLHLFRPIMQGDEQVGTIELVADLSDLPERLWRYAGLAGVILIVSLLVAFGLSSWLQKLISDPILHLAQVARSVALEKNYSVRATKQSTDELGQLVDGFNEMLAQIQERDAKLELRVEERTNELAKSLSLLNTTLESTADGILVVNLAGQISSYNQKFIKLWKISEAILATHDDEQLLAAALTQLIRPEEFLTKVKELYAHPERLSSDIVELADGRVFERFSQPQKLGDKCIGRVWSFRDITERKQAELELSYERDLLRALLDYSPDPIYFKDTQSRFLKASKVLAGLFGAKNPEELVGKTDFDFFTAEHARPAFEDEQEIIRTDRPMIGKVEREVWNDGRESWALTSKMPLRNKEGQIIGTFGITKDITVIKETEAQLEQVHKQLLDASRRGGMAEIATNVLHNVGNVLNSVNVSAGLVAEGVKKSKVTSLRKVVGLLNEHAHDLGAFITTDVKGKQLPTYLAQLSDQLQADQAAMLTELDSLRQNVEHIKEIVAMQQSYATFGGVKEVINVVDLVEDSLRMNAGAMSRHQVTVVREFEPVPPLNVEKHKILQVLVNLLRNAKHACQDSDRADKRLTVRVTNGEGRIKIAVVDNGVGIPAENLTRIFNHGFTTKKGGHGFGLHSGALAAKEMGGALTVHSDGPGQGAIFTLELPVQPES